MLAGNSIHRPLSPPICGLQSWGHPDIRTIPAPGLSGQMEIRMVEDSESYAMEVGFASARLLAGDATRGWVDSEERVALTLQTSPDLSVWTEGLFVDCPGSPELVDGQYEYWSRCTIPVYWLAVMVDYTLGSNRYGKSIESLQINNVEIALDYPYAMPADCATLQADLRTAGYTDATVTTTTAALSVGITNHTVDGRFFLTPTLSGSAVVNVAFRTSNITLPDYPYAMPSDQAALQADLRSVGYSGAVVMLYDDPWEIFIPDQDATANFRAFIAIIDPGDPYPFWNSFKYQGLAPATQINGTSGNVRTPEGDPLLEAAKQFARLKISQS
jgi:hypothetical protein